MPSVEIREKPLLRRISREILEGVASRLEGKGMLDAMGLLSFPR